MADEQKTGRRPRLAFDQDDEDVTPPPREPPSIEDIDGFTQLPEAVQNALTMLHNTQREHDVAFTRLWDARHVRHELGIVHRRTGDILDHVGRLSNIPALLQSQAVSIAQLVTWKESKQSVDTRIERTLRELDRRLDDIERTTIHLDSTISQISARLIELATAMRAGDEKNAAEIVDLKNRVTSLEHARTAAGAKMGMIAAFAAVLVTIAGWVVNRLWK